MDSSDLPQVPSPSRNCASLLSFTARRRHCRRSPLLRRLPPHARGGPHHGLVRSTGILQPMTFEFGQPRVVHPASASCFSRSGIWKKEAPERRPSAVLHIDSTVSFESVIYHYFDVQQHARC